MKKIPALLTATALMLGLCACAQSSTATWREQYDLGVRYLSESNYRDAILAFTAAIEIDPKRADAYLGLADACESQGDMERARQVLEDALTVVANPDVIRKRLGKLEASTAPKFTPGITAEPTQELTPIPTPSSDSDFVIENGVLVEYIGQGGAVTIPNGVTSIGDRAFLHCENLASITIPNSITRNGKLAFGGCSSLSNVTIPNSVTSIGERVFVECSSLSNIEVARGNPVYSSIDGVLFNADQTQLYAYPSGKKGLYNIPIYVTTIEDYAFSYCNGLTNVTIPDHVTSIGKYVFVGCSNLSSIEVARGNPTYSSVDGVLFNADQTWLHAYPSGKSGAYNIPTSVTTIGDYAFSYCSGLTNVTIPNSVTNIGGYAFSYCDRLTSVTIPDGVTSIDTGAFEYCNSLISISIPNSVTSIGGLVFYGCNSLTSVSIPNGVTNIGGSAFAYCDNLTSVTIPNSVTNIGKDAFQECHSLTSVTIPNSVISIGSYAFFNCDRLTSVTIPSSVTNIGESAFLFCYSLTDVYYEGSEAQWNQVAIDEYNELLLDAVIHYNR